MTVPINTVTTGRPSPRSYVGRHRAPKGPRCMVCGDSGFVSDMEGNLLGSCSCPSGTDPERRLDSHGADT